MNTPADTFHRRGFLTAAAASAAGAMLAGSGAAQPRAAAEKIGRAGRLRAGAAVTKITPEPGVSLEGYFMKLGPVKSVHDDLHARCLVLDDGAERVAICICDMTVIPRDVFDKAKELVHRRAGLPTNRMLMAATHTHSAPRVGLAQGELDKKYVEFLIRQMAEAVCRAIDNLAPAKVGWGTAEKPEFTFNRRWFMKPGTVPTNPFGEDTDRVQFNPPRGSGNLVQPAGPVDPLLSVLSVQHADGRPMALLANYSIHYVGGFARQEVSADYFGVFAARIGELLGAGPLEPRFVGIMSNGTSGNIGGPDSFRKPRPKLPPYERMRQVGCRLADAALRICRQIDHRDRVPLAMRQTELELGIRRPDEARLAWAREVLSNPQRKHAHRWTPLYAQEAILLSQGPATVSHKLQAIRVGELGIGAIPCEVFAETGLAIKKGSPLKPTFIIELANGYGGYLPTPEQHELGGYETWDARSSCLEVDAEPKIRAAVLELLGQVAPAGTKTR